MKLDRKIRKSIVEILSKKPMVETQLAVSLSEINIKMSRPTLQAYLRELMDKKKIKCVFIGTKSDKGTPVSIPFYKVS